MAKGVALVKRGNYLGQVLEEADILKLKKFLSKLKVELQVGTSKGVFKVEGFFYESGNAVIMKPKNAAIFVTTDGKKIEQAYFESEKPKDDEVCFFIEDNTDDWSNAKLYALFGKNVKKEILLKTSKVGYVNAYLKSIPGISDEIIQELIEKGVVIQSKGIIKSILVDLSYVLAGVSLISAGIGWFADELGTIFLNNLTIGEVAWNTDSEGYFLKKENLINSLTIGNEKMAIIGNELKPKGNNPLLQNLSAVFINDYSLKNIAVVNTFITSYNDYVTKSINALFENVEKIDDNEKSNYISEFVAFLCGVWNGLVDFIGSSLKFIGLILKTPYEVTFNLESILETFDNFCAAISSIWGRIFEVFSTAFANAKAYFKTKSGEDINNDKVAYALGFGLSFVATLFIPYTQLLKFANFSKIGKAFLPAKFLEEISISTEKAINFVSNTSKTAFDAASKIIDDIIALLFKGKQALQKLLDDLIKKIINWFRKNSKLVRVGENEVKSLLNISYRLVQEAELHIHKGIIKIQKIDPKLPKTDAKRIIEEYSYLPAKNAGKTPLKKFKYKVKVVGLYNQNNLIRGVVERIGRFKKIGKLPTGENVYEVNVQFFIKGLGKWETKKYTSTLYPKTWSEAKINQIILEASENIIFKDGRNIIGIAKNGTKIEMWIKEASQEIETAWITFKII